MTKKQLAWKAWLEKNREHRRKYHREYSRKWRAANRELLRGRHQEYSRKWRANHPEAVARSAKAWRDANPEKARAIHYKASLKWVRANPEKVKANSANWSKNNPVKVRLKTHRRRVLLSGSDFSEQEWDEILRLWHYHCAYCLMPQELLDVDLTIEHVIPISRGGTHTKDNIVPACRSCNSSKGNKLVSEWIHLQTL